MPESYGKRQRSMQKAKKFAAREERRAARKQQKADEAAGIVRDETGAEITADEGLDPEAEGAEQETAEAPAGGSDESQE